MKKITAVLCMGFVINFFICYFTNGFLVIWLFTFLLPLGAVNAYHFSYESHFYPCDRVNLWDAWKHMLREFILVREVLLLYFTNSYHPGVQKGLENLSISWNYYHICYSFSFIILFFLLFYNLCLSKISLHITLFYHYYLYLSVFIPNLRPQGLVRNIENKEK
jgi:hypothetical protein